MGNFVSNIVMVIVRWVCEVGVGNMAKEQNTTLDVRSNDAHHDIPSERETPPDNLRADLLFGTDNTYNAGGLKRSLHGIVYQLKLIMLFVVRARNKSYEFCLATEIDAAEKFDDILLKYIKSGRKILRFVQAKHKKDVDKNKITFNDLTSNNNDFSLQKYFVSYCKIKHNTLFKDADLEDFLIITNIDFDENEPKKDRRKKRLETFKSLFGPVSDLDKDDILHSFKAAKYKFKESAIPILKEIFKRNLLDSALKSRQIQVGSAVEEKLNSLKNLHFEDLANEASQAAENIRNEYNHERRKGRIYTEAATILRLKDIICKTEEFKDLEKAVDNLEKTPVYKTKNITKLTKALENVRDTAQVVAKKAQNDLTNSKLILAKYKDENTDEFKRLDADKRKLSSDECQFRHLIERISDATSLEPIKKEIYKKLSENNFDENGEFDALKDRLIKKFERIITDISIVQVAINDDTFENCFDEFIEKFSIVTQFPIEEELGKHIVSELDGQFDILSADLVSDSFQREVLDFFKFYEDGKARGYTSTDAETFFSNMRRQESMMRDKLIQLIDYKQINRR